MKTRDQLERYAEVIHSAIHSRKTTACEEHQREDWELAYAIISWVLEERTMDREMVETWLVDESRHEVGLPPEQ